MYHGWEGKCSEILATPSYSKNRRVNKDIYDMMINLHSADVHGEMAFSILEKSDTR